VALTKAIVGHVVEVGVTLLNVVIVLIREGRRGRDNISSVVLCGLIDRQRRLKRVIPKLNKGDLRIHPPSSDQSSGLIRSVTPYILLCISK
jgi:hypothetical protein